MHVQFQYLDLQGNFSVYDVGSENKNMILYDSLAVAAY